MHNCLNLREIKGVKLLLRYGFDPLRHFEYTQKWSNATEKQLSEIKKCFLKGIGQFFSIFFIRPPKVCLD